jgi:hypothetical protein
MTDYLLLLYEQQLRNSGGDKSIKGTNWTAIFDAMKTKYPGMLWYCTYKMLLNFYSYFIYALHLFSLSLRSFESNSSQSNSIRGNLGKSSVKAAEALGKDIASAGF